MTAADQPRTMLHSHITEPHKSSIFGRFARAVAGLLGQPVSFVIACALVFSWGITGPLFGFSSTWQLMINTGTTIATFLMIFLLQNTQNRDSAAFQVKLDELIRAVEGADNRLLDVEEADQRDLDKARSEYRSLAKDEIESANRTTQNQPTDPKRI